jgi:hypothetical protein
MFGQQGKENFNQLPQTTGESFLQKTSDKRAQAGNLSDSMSAKHNPARHWIACSTEAPEACDGLTALLLADGRAYCTAHDCAA